jgi:hypothetical protein
MEEKDRGTHGSHGKPTSHDHSEFEKLAVRLQSMSANERIKLALIGDAEARRLLIRDPSREVQMAILKNPRITESELISIANSRSTSEEMVRAILSNRDWYKIYAIRLALVKNPKTPFAQAIRMVAGLATHDLKLLAKSKSISPAVVQQAKKLVAKSQ